MAIKIRGITVLGYGVSDLDSSNIAVGAEALNSITAAAEQNTAVGNRAGSNLTTGINNILIGYNAAASDSTASDEIVIGNNSNSRIRIPGLGLDTNTGLAGQVLCWNGSQFTFDSAIASAVIGGTGIDSATVVALIDSAVTVGINALIDGAPDALNTLNELAEALNDDSAAYDTLVSLINGRMSEADVTTLIDSAYVRARQDYSYSSLTGTPNVLDSADVLAIANVSSAGLDSASVIDLVDSAYVQARQTPQDFAYGSLTGTPNVLDSADVSSIAGSLSGLDSVGISNLVDSAYVQARQDFAYGSLTGTPTLFNGTYDSLTGTPNVLDSADVLAIANVSSAGLDSASVIDLVDSAYVQARQDFAYGSLTGRPNVLDSADVLAIANVSSAGLDSASVIDLIDSAYINFRVDAVQASGVDSAAIISLVDSAYVQARQTPQDFAYSSLTGTPNVLDSANVISLITTTVGVDSSFVTTAIDSAIDALIDGAPGALDTLNELAAALNDDSQAYNTLLSQINTKISASDIPAIVDSDYITLRIPISFDSAAVLTVVDSAYVQARQDFAYSSLTGTPTLFNGTYDSLTGRPNVLDSADVLAIANVSSAGLDSAQAIQLIDSAYVQARQDYTYSSLTGTPNVLDSADVSSIAGSLSGLDSTGVVSLITADYIEARRPAEAIFSVTNNGASAYTFLPSDGFADSSDNPTLYLQRGLTYKFEMNASGHPFEIRLSDGGSAYSSGVTNNAAEVGDVLFTVPMNAPNSLVYQCTVHSGMVGDIVIFDQQSFVDSSDVNLIITSVVDSAYVAARAGGAVGSGGLDSAAVIQLIDSAYVAAREANAGVSGGGLDSAAVIALVGTGAERGLTTFTYIADSGQTVFSGPDFDGDSLSYNSSSLVVFLNGILLVEGNDYSASNGTSVTFTEGVDSGSFITLLNISSTGGVDSASTITLITSTVDSDYVLARAGSAGLDSATVITLIDSDYVLARAGSAGLDSATVITLIDSDYINARVDAAAASGGGLTTFEFTADSGDTTITGVDIYGNTLSYTASGVVVYVNGVLLRDSDYTATNGTSISFTTSLFEDDEVTVHNITAGASSGGLDSAQAILLIDSNYVQARQDYSYSSLTGTPNTIDSAGVIQLVDSAYVAARAGGAVGSGGLDSAAVLNLFNTGSYTGVRTFQYTADSGQTAFSGTDDFGATLNYNVANLLVFLNGILLVDSADYSATNGTSINLVREAGLNDLLTAINISAGGLDSASITGLIDSDYVSARAGGGGGGGASTGTAIAMSLIWG